MKKAAIYARVSTALQEKERTIESQIEELKKQVSKSGDVLTKEYIDDGYSGAKIDRPALDQLRSDLKTPLFDTIYFLNSDRIARDVTYQNLIIAEILKYKKQIIINGKDYIHNPENKFTLTVLGAVSELERAKIIERSQRGKLHKLRQGIPLNYGYNALGYEYIRRTDTQPGKFIINEKEAKTVRYIFKSYAAGFSWAKLVRTLENIGAITKMGRKLWDTSKLKNILQNHTYTGIKYYNTRSYVKEPNSPLRGLKYGKKVYKNKSEWIPVKVPAIISQELFNKVQARIKYNSEQYRNPKQTQLLSGLVNCGICGRFFTSYFRTYKDKRRVADPNKIFHKTAYRCSQISLQRMHSQTANTGLVRCNNPEVLTQLLDTCVMNMIEESMTDSSKLELCLTTNVGQLKNRKQIESKLKENGKRIADLATKRKQTIDQYASGKINRAEYVKRCLSYDSELTNHNVNKAKLLNQVPSLHKEEVIEASIKRYCESVRSRLNLCNNSDKTREFLKDYIKEVIYNNTEVKVIGSIPIKLKAYDDPDQTSDASAIQFKIEGKIKRGNKWMGRKKSN
ncbi:MAG: recombinase family protein [Candidatus Doudnabacteria bacterium]|nr:recombinase family protein [Candidatus Doudnabacteria bacterium]